jgi:hypothetical protein
LVFLDFQYDNFNKQLIKNLPINLLYVDKSICCMFLKSETCECPHDFSLQESFLILATDIIKRVLYAMVTENSELTTNLSCEDAHYNAQSTNRFYELLGQEVDQNHLVVKENNALRVDFNGSIEVGVGQTSEKVANYNFKKGVTVLEGKKINPITAFFRIGITHVKSFQCQFSPVQTISCRRCRGPTKKPTLRAKPSGPGTAWTSPTN